MSTSKWGGCDLTEFLTSFLNYIISTKMVSAVLKEGILTPIFKKGDTSDPGNYRGITVTPVLLKILEHILNARHNEIFISTQSLLQRGFTEGCSSLNAAVILTECVLKASHNKQDLWAGIFSTFLGRGPRAFCFGKFSAFQLKLGKFLHSFL